MGGKITVIVYTNLHDAMLEELRFLQQELVLFFNSMLNGTLYNSQHQKLD